MQKKIFLFLVCGLLFVGKAWPSPLPRRGAATATAATATVATAATATVATAGLRAVEATATVATAVEATDTVQVLALPLAPVSSAV